MKEVWSQMYLFMNIKKNRKSHYGGKFEKQKL